MEVAEAESHALHEERQAQLCEEAQAQAFMFAQQHAGERTTLRERNEELEALRLKDQQEKGEMVATLRKQRETYLFLTVDKGNLQLSVRELEQAASEIKNEAASAAPELEAQEQLAQTAEARAESLQTALERRSRAQIRENESTDSEFKAELETARKAKADVDARYRTFLEASLSDERRTREELASIFQESGRRVGLQSPRKTRSEHSKKKDDFDPRQNKLSRP